MAEPKPRLARGFGSAFRKSLFDTLKTPGIAPGGFGCSSAAAAVVIAAVSKAAAAAAEDQHQNDDPPPVVAAEPTDAVGIAVHKMTS